MLTSRDTNHITFVPELPKLGSLQALSSRTLPTAFTGGSPLGAVEADQVSPPLLSPAAAAWSGRTVLSDIASFSSSVPAVPPCLSAGWRTFVEPSLSDPLDELCELLQRIRETT
jgi:hypothetical protein